MCGIVGYVGNRPVQELLLAGLREARIPRLRQRRHLGAARGTRSSRCARSATSRALREAVEAARRRGRWRRGRGAAPTATTGIGHTRWATHGRRQRGERASRTTTPPTASTSSSTGSSRTTWRCASAWSPTARVFTSETDAEVIAHLIADALRRRPGRRRARRLQRARGPLRVRRAWPPTSPTCSSARARSAR